MRSTGLGWPCLSETRRGTPTRQRAALQWGRVRGRRRHRRAGRQGKPRPAVRAAAALPRHAGPLRRRLLLRRHCAHLSGDACPRTPTSDARPGGRAPPRAAAILDPHRVPDEHVGATRARRAASSRRSPPKRRHGRGLASGAQEGRVGAAACRLPKMSRSAGEWHRHLRAGAPSRATGAASEVPKRTARAPARAPPTHTAENCPQASSTL
jgi:hypothetical protein